MSTRSITKAKTILESVKAYPEEEREDMLLFFISQALIDAGYDLGPEEKRIWDKGNDWYAH